MEMMIEPPAQATEQKPGQDTEIPWQPFGGDFFGMDVLAIHEDLPTGLRTKELIGKLESQLELDMTVLTTWCRFEMLEDKDLAGMAMEQAKRSSVVILSLHGDQPLPSTVQDWLLQWLQATEFKPCALVMLMDASAADSLKANTTYQLLKTITGPMEIDFFCIWADQKWLGK